MRRRPGTAPRARARVKEPKAGFLTDLVRVSEDVADGLIADQRLKQERRYSLEQVLRELGYEGIRG